MAKRKKYDWDVIEREYRAGQLSLREIARQHGCSFQAISQRAKRHGWKRDLTAAVRQRVNAKLVDVDIDVDTLSAEPSEIIEKAATRGAGIVTLHRKDIGDGRNFVGLFYEQLRDAAENREKIEDEIYNNTKSSTEDGKPDIKRRSQMLKAVSLPAHVGILRDLSVALKNLIPLERQAFNLDSPIENIGINDVIASLPDGFRDAVCSALGQLVSK